ncbi:MAG: hypothetical protein GQ467_00680 [Mariprofundaceae bacterium]|jgi:hypothetical protein|nr:hypothetical protein [Mariprofundaceae bacterium]
MPDTLIIAEGDSWFNHPLLRGIPYYLKKMDRRYHKELLAWPGDDMVRFLQRRDYLIELRSWAGNGMIKHRFLILSGGGNDMMANHFDEYLDSAQSPFLNVTFKKKMAQLIATYDLVFQLVQQKHEDVNVLVHGYAVPFPRANGSHLGKKMKKMGITNLETDGAVIMETIIGDFNTKLKALTDKYDKVEYIDLRDLAKVKTNWNDEIHPKKAVFKQMAKRFHDKIQNHLA